MTQMSTPPLPTAAAASDSSTNPTRLKGRLGVLSLVLTVLAFNAPLAVMAGYVPLVIGSGNQTGAPAIYILLGVVYLIFAVGLTAMAKFMKNPGAFYSYIVAGIGRPTGLGGAFIAFAAYIAFSACSYPYAGILTNALVHDVFGGPQISWWIWALALWAAATLLSLFNIALSAKVLGITMAAEVLMVVIWQIAVASDGGPTGRAFQWYTPEAFTSGSLSLGLLFGVLCVTGFEAVAVFREETINPEKTVPRATYAAILALVALYGFGAWAYIVAYGPTDAVANGAADPSGSFTSSVIEYVGPIAGDIVAVLLVTSAFAAMLATQNIAARYLFTLGRDGVISTRLGRVHVRHGSPMIAAAFVGIVVFVVVAVPTIAGMEPLQMYAAMGGFAGICLLLLMTTTALSIFMYFRKSKLHRANIFQSTVAPLIALAALLVVFVFAASKAGSLVGGSTTDGYLVLGSVAAIALAGVVVALRAKKRSPEVYSRIGSQSL